MSSRQELIDGILAWICERFERNELTLNNLQEELNANFPMYPWSKTDNAKSNKKTNELK